MSSRGPTDLPADPSVLELPLGERRAVAESWRGRATNELSTSTVFANLARALVAFQAPLALVREAATAVADEVAHAEICLHVARVYFPDVAAPDPSPVMEPSAFQGDPRLGTVLFTVMQSCINEGVATVYLQQCLDEAERPLARAAVRSILEDEIKHARFGWTLLASPSIVPAWRPEIGRALPTLLTLVADAWVGLTALSPIHVPKGHGALVPSAMAEVVRQALADLVVPGFDHVGIETRPARAWLARRRWPEPSRRGPALT